MKTSVRTKHLDGIYAFISHHEFFILGIKTGTEGAASKHNKPGRNTGNSCKACSPFALALCLHMSALSQARIKCQLKVPELS